MKTNFLFHTIFFTFIISSVFGQSFLQEDFNSEDMPPEGWTIEEYSEQWSINSSNYAGGEAPEARFAYTNGVDLTRLISPTIDLAGYEIITVSFKHLYDHYSGDAPALGLATRSGDGEWTSVWEIISNDNFGPEEKVIDIDNADVGQTDFQICFYIDGDFWNMNYWYIDDVEVYKAINLDVGLIEINTPSIVYEFPVEISGSFINNGSFQLISLDVNWQAPEGNMFTTSYDSLMLEQNQVFNFVCDDLFDYPVGSYLVDIWVSNVNGEVDEYPENDSITITISTPSHHMQNRPCFEQFTSSSSDVCAIYNETYNVWTEENSDVVTYISYPLDWPYEGDPYYIEDCDIRRDFYASGWLPWTSGDGNYVAGLENLESTLTNNINAPAFAALNASFSLDGETITINTSILPFISFQELNLHTVVFENITTGNVGNNGETEFKNVVMKMVPDAFGTTIDLEDRNPTSLDQSIDLSGTNIEEFDDLGVLIFLQNEQTKDIYQSNYADENGTFNDNALLSSIQLFGVEINDFSPEVFQYDINLTTDTLLPQIIAIPEDPNAIPVLFNTVTIPGTSSIEVYSEDFYTMNTYELTFSLITTDVDVPHLQDFNIYPNPSNGIITIPNNIKTVEIYDLSGLRLYKKEHLKSNMLNLSILDSGIYLIKFLTNSGKMVFAKISIIK